MEVATLEVTESRRARRFAGPALSAVLLVAVVAVLLPRVAGWEQARALLAAMPATEIAVLLLATAVNLASFAFVTIAALPGLTLGRAVVVNQGTAALANTLPYGDAVSIGLASAMYGSWGFGPAQIGLAIVAGGAANLVAKLLVPVAALALLAATGGTAGHLLPLAGMASCAVAAGALLVAALVDRRVAAWIGRGLGRTVSWARGLTGRGAVQGWGARAQALRDDAVALLRRRGLALAAAGIVSHLAAFTVLLVALRLVGVGGADVSVVEALAAFAFAFLVTTLPLPAGGLGVVDLGLQAGLVAAGAAAGPALAAVLLFRACTYLLPVPLGAVVWVAWRVSAAARR